MEAIVIVEGNPGGAPHCWRCGKYGSGVLHHSDHQMKWLGRITEDRHAWRCPEGHVTSTQCIEMTDLWGYGVYGNARREDEDVSIMDKPQGMNAYFQDPELRAEKEERDRRYATTDELKEEHEVPSRDVSKGTIRAGGRTPKTPPPVN